MSVWPQLVHHHCRTVWGMDGDLCRIPGGPAGELPGSACDHGLVSLPYLDGPELENVGNADVMGKCLWLIPITKAEVEYKKAFGLEALEQRFEAAQFDYADPNRASVA